MRPRSRGTVRLQSSDPTAAPLIDPNYWADSYDREMTIRGLKLAREIMRQPALAPYIKVEQLPGAGVVTDEDYIEYCCRHAKTDHHPAGTCRMGADPTAVVDPQLKFNGVASLRVVDASIMPTLISSNTNAATIMIAEKAADMIRQAG
jgi:choline dehydrogenase